MEASQNRELRLFLSSTFRDLQPEREFLVKKVFPRIRKECRERGVEFTEIDLRWGITEEESRSGKTIRICLEEIDRCRPYFIGIIGSRYGWVPGITEIEKDPEMLKEFPWLAEYGSNDKSIIEMEFAHGAMLQKNESAFFYEQISYSRNPVAVNGTDPYDGSLDSLKSSLQSAGVYLRPFATPEELGEQVFQDIVKILDRDFPAKKEMTPLERERIEHEAFARNRRQSYVANQEYYNAFVKHVESDGPPLIVWGKSGLGKSALMAYLAHEYQTRNPNAFVVQHFIGAAEGSDPEDVMRQVMMEIKERYQLSDAIPTDDNALREEFPVWLAKVGQNTLLNQNPLLFKEGAGGGSHAPGQPPPRIVGDAPRLEKAGESDFEKAGESGDKLILLIDALNQLTGIAPEMHWMPEFFPPNVRLIVSTTTESLPLEQLRKRAWDELELQPLTEQQRESISQGFLQRYRKSLTPSDLHTLSANAKSSSPLFLRTLLEELRIFGSHSTLHEELEDYLACADERELFQKVLARMERDHGAEHVRSVMTAVWASRHGLSEAELMEITGFPRMALSELMIGMEYHLMQREGFHNFFHNYLREAIEQRYVPKDDAKKASHAQIGRYFSMREFGERRRAEEPWQWQAAQDHDALQRSLLEPEMIALLETDHERYEALGYWREFEKVEIDAEYVPHLMGSGLPSNTIVQAFTNAVELLVLASEYTRADELFNAGYPKIRELDVDRERQFHLEEKEIIILNALSKYDSVIRRAEELLQNAALERYPEIRFRVRNHIVFAYHGLGKFGDAENLILQSMEDCIALFGSRSEEFAGQLNDLASLLTLQERYDEAETHFQRSLELVSELFGAMDTRVAMALKQLGANAIRMGSFDEAIVNLEHAETIFLNTVGPSHEYTCICRQQLANAKLGLQDIPGARSLYESIVESARNRYGPLPQVVMASGISIGYLYYIEGNYEASIPYYEKYLPYYEETYGSGNSELIKARARMEEMREKLGIARIGEPGSDFEARAPILKK